MPIKKYFANADNVITNRFKSGSSDLRCTGSNAGASDIIEAYSFYNRLGTGDQELVRSIIQFPISDISSSRQQGEIPASGSVNFKLKLYNSKHFYSLPFGYDIQVAAVQGAWEEGLGVDLENYSQNTSNQIGSNWMNANNTFTSASFTISLQGGANKAAMSGQTFALTDSDGTSQTFTFNIANDTVTSGTIGMSSDSNTTDIIATIKAAINDASLSSLDITASTITAVGDADSEMRLLVKQKTTGFAGNTTVDLSGVTHLSVLNSATGFTGGSGAWATPGGDFYTDASSSFTQSIKVATDDLDIDVTSLVEQWITGSSNGGKDNYGFIIKLSDEFESFFSSSTGKFSGSVLHNPSGSKKSYYRKMFFGRGTEFFYKRPVIEARYQDTIKDDRNKFYISSSLKQTFAENLNRLYFYNRHAANLIDIGGSSGNLPTVQLYYSSGSVPEGSARGFLNSGGSAVTTLTATRESTGIYYVDVAVTGGAVTSTYPYLVDVWSYGGQQVLSGSAITLLKNVPAYSSVKDNYILAIPNLVPEYHCKDVARLRLYVRNKKWSPNVYTVSKDKPEGVTIESAFYRILRSIDDYEVIPYGTGSMKYTELSYDGEGNYFDINMSSFEKGYQYTIKIAFYDEYTKKYQEQPYNFKFRVVE